MRVFLIMCLIAGAFTAIPLFFPPTGQKIDGPVSEAPVRDRGEPGWRRDAVWDDGNAEFAVYRVTWPRYGHLRQGRALLICVKEPWAPDLEVKADRPRVNGLDVLKLNHIRDVATGIYTYHQMVSVFVERASGKLRKIAAASTEACGVSTAHMVRGRLDLRSYFDGQGDRSLDWPVAAVPEDGLPMILRDFVRGEIPQSIDVFPTLMTGRFAEPMSVRCRLARREIRDVEVPEGHRKRAVAIDVVRGDETLTYVFEVQAPHVMLEHRRDDGTHYSLVKVGRIPYWNMHDPGDESWLPEDVRR